VGGTRLDHVTTLREIHRSRQGAAQLVAPVILNARKLVTADLEIRLRRVSVLAHRREIRGVERRQISKAGDRIVLVVLPHVEVMDVQHAAWRHEVRPVHRADSAAVIGRRCYRSGGRRIQIRILDTGGTMPIADIDLLADRRDERELAVQFASGSDFVRQRGCHFVEAVPLTPRE
jgi:hypothetical protein